MVNQAVATRVLPGKPYPLGATWTGEGVNFSIYSEGATKVELCLFDHEGSKTESRRIYLPETTDRIWHAMIVGLRPGQMYGYRVYGPYDPEAGQRFNPAKLLIDPYAKAISGSVNWQAPVFAYQLGHKDEDLARNDEDDAWGMPKCVVSDPTFDWEGDRQLKIPWHKTIIYETHVKGFTILHPDVPEEIRGTYTGLSSPPMIKHLKSLGITAVEIMPVHEFLDEKSLIDKGLKNYWGYNTTNFFSPDARYSSLGDTGSQITEFKSMVKSLHQAGIEIILDVVYNHTSEGNQLGPTLSFKGIDNTSYYRLLKDRNRYYMDYTGTGNTLNASHPQVLKLIMDSLRYWVTDMHVDGFRFDLASTLARELHDVDRLSAFFDIIHQDPTISSVKLIAEPWDVGEGGYQVGKFPVLWTEWNGKYRDSIRRFWKGDEGSVAELAYRITGSSDLYQQDGRKPYASVNFITAHDGFTLNDLVSYENKNNEANGENNKDGYDINLSWNCGDEGPTADTHVIELRENQKRNFLATLILSQGVPMLHGGDEISLTQRGNNNAYCQDNEITWYDWNLSSRQLKLLDFVKYLINFRHDHQTFQRRNFFQGRPIRGSNIKDIMWFRSDGQEMTDQDWNSSWIRCIGLFLAGNIPDEMDEKGIPLKDDSLIIIMNSHHEHISFTIPAFLPNSVWNIEIDTHISEFQESREIKIGETLDIQGRSLVLLICDGDIKIPKQG
jgi:isoamylase